MAIPITCQTCDKRFSVNESLVGKKGKCKCGTIFTIAAPPVNDLPASFDDIDFSQVSEAPPPAAAVRTAAAPATMAAPIGTRGAAVAPSRVGGRADANELIDSGAGFGRIKKLFPDAESALLYIANRQKAAYGHRGGGGPCVCCNRAGAPLRQFSWQTQFGNRVSFNPLSILTVFFGFVIIRRGGARVITFSTYHSVCGICLARAAFRRVLALGVMILGLPIFVLGTCLVLLTLDNSSAIFAEVGAVLALIAIAMFVFGAKGRGPAPTGMRRFVLRPFYCKRVTSV